MLLTFGFLLAFSFLLNFHIKQIEIISGLDLKIHQKYLGLLSTLRNILIVNLVLQILKMIYPRLSYQLYYHCDFQTFNYFWNNVLYFVSSPLCYINQIAVFLIVFWKKKLDPNLIANNPGVLASMNVRRSTLPSNS